MQPDQRRQMAIFTDSEIPPLRPWAALGKTSITWWVPVGRNCVIEQVRQ